MFSQLSQKISYQFFLLLFLLVVSLLLPMTYFAWKAVVDFGDSAGHINQSFIADRAFDFLLNKTKEQSLRYEGYFEKVRVTASMLGAKAQQIYDSMDEQGEITYLPFVMWQNPGNGIFYTPSDEQVMSLYWGGASVDTKVFREIAALTELDPLMITAKRQVADSIAVHMITTSGVGKYFPDNAQLKKQAEMLPPPSFFDLRDGVPYTIFLDGVRRRGGAEWTPVYKDDFDEGLMVTASAPVYDRYNNLLAITGIDVSLNWLEHELLSYFPTDHMQENENSINFIVNSEGQLIIIPKQYFEILGLRFDAANLKYSSDVFEYSLLDSENHTVRRLHDRIIRQGNSLFSTTINGEQYVVVSCKMEKLGWHMVHLLTRKTLFQTVNQTDIALKETLKTLKRKFINFFLIVIFALLIGMILVVRRYISPLQLLGHTAAEIGRGNLSTRCELNRDDELGRVAVSMNEMAAQLDRIDKQKKVYTEELEEMVADRVRDLAKKNIELERMVYRLHRESDRHQVTAEALRENEERLRSITEFSLAGLLVTQDNTMKYYNHGFVKMAGYEKGELVGPLDFRKFVVEEDLPLIVENMQQRSKGEGGKYQVRGIRKDGSVIQVLIEAVPIIWDGRPGALATLVDITLLKEIEKRLQQTVEEKEILLKEVYHRTKNNMLVIISLLTLQADEISDPKMQKIFFETENRIRAMSLIHESLYQTHNLANIDIGEYLRNLATELVASMTLRWDIDLTVESDAMIISIDKAMPLGLIANEIVTNAIQHAFYEQLEKKIYIGLNKRDGGEFELVIKDNGVGIGSECLEDTEQFGLMVIRNLIEMQLQGKYSVSSDNGTCYTITFTD